MVAAELLARSLRQVRPDDARRTWLTDQLQESTFILGRYEQTVQLAQEARPVATVSDRDGRATWLRIYALQRLRRHDDAAAVLAAAEGRPDVAPVWQARFCALRAIVTRSLGEPAEARRYACAALAAGRELGDSNATGYALHALAVQRADDHDYEGGCRLIDEALPVAERDPGLGDLWAMLVYNRVSWGAQLGDYKEARTLALDALARGELSGSPRLSRLHGLVASIAYETGAWDQALTELDASTGTGVDEHLDDAPYLRTLIAGHRDEWLEAESELATVRRSTDGFAPPVGLMVRQRAGESPPLRCSTSSGRSSSKRRRFCCGGSSRAPRPHSPISSTWRCRASSACCLRPGTYRGPGLRPMPPSARLSGIRWPVSRRVPGGAAGL